MSPVCGIFQENGLAITLTWQNEPLCNKVVKVVVVGNLLHKVMYIIVTVILKGIILTLVRVDFVVTVKTELYKIDIDIKIMKKKKHQFKSSHDALRYQVSLIAEYDLTINIKK